MTPTVHVNFTNGFGNNCFQYIYARLIAESHKGLVSCMSSFGGHLTYIPEEFGKVGIRLTLAQRTRKSILVNDTNASTDFYDRKHDGKDFLVSGYFEDYNLYKGRIEEIKSWFLPIEKKNVGDLVLHIRMGDRLFLSDSYRPKMLVSFETYLNAIKNFDFDRLFIVTDMREWRTLTEKEFLKMKFHEGTLTSSGLLGKPGYISDCSPAVEYWNNLVEGLNKLHPIVRCSCSPGEDFNFIRQFDKILFQHSTLSWWAAILSSASKVGVYGPWRPAKGKKNKNLSQVDLPGWFQWE